MSAAVQEAARIKTARQMRVLAGLTVAQLARQANTSTTTISFLEKGRTRQPGARSKGLLDRLRGVMGEAYVEALVCGPWAS